MNSKNSDALQSPPVVSICIPTYNDASKLGEMLQSIISQTYSQIEIEIGDDASTDNTQQVVQAFSDSRIRYHRNEKNLGQFPNVNSILKRARGEYVAIFHSDDLYEPRIVAEEIEFLTSHPEVAAVFSMDYRITHDGKLIGVTRLPEGLPSRTPLQLKDLMPFLLRLKNIIIRTPSFMGRRDVFDDVGYFRDDFDIAGDFEMWLRIMRKYPIAILEEPLLHYRHAENQVSSTYNRLRTFQEHYFPIMDMYLNEPGIRQDIDDESLVEYAFHLADDMTTRAANHVILGQTDDAKQLLSQPFPWRTFAVGLTRRKFRVVLMRVILRVGLALRATKPLGVLLEITEK